jgi:hypothetical protein
VERVATAIGLLLQAVGLFGFVLWAALVGYPDALILLLLACLPLSIAAAVAIVADPKPGEKSATAARVILLAQVAAELFLVGLLLFRVGQNLIEASTFGIDGRVDALRFGLATIGTFLLAGCVRAPHVTRVSGSAAQKALRYRRTTGIVAALVASSLFVVAIAGATVSRHALRCAPFSFDKQRWDSSGPGSDRVRIGRALARCETLEGKTSTEVAQMLDIKPGQRSVYLGPPNGLDEGSRTLIISYDGDGRVTGAQLPNPVAD